MVFNDWYTNRNAADPSRGYSEIALTMYAWQIF
jgi:hypothetical protein